MDPGPGPGTVGPTPSRRCDGRVDDAPCRLVGPPMWNDNPARNSVVSAGANGAPGNTKRDIRHRESPKASIADPMGIEVHAP